MTLDAPFTQETIEFHSQGCRLRGCLYAPESASPAAVVLCHGALEHQGNWSAYARRLAANGYTALTFDFAGHGDSEGLESAVQMQTWAYNLRDALNFLARRGCQRFALVGWNSGGSAALLAAAHDPRVKCLAVLAAPVLMMPSLADRIVYGFTAFLSRLLHPLRRRPLSVSRLREAQGLEMAADPAANAAYFADERVRQAYAAVPVSESLDSVWIDITRSLKRIAAPTLVLHGGKDRIVPPAQSERLYAALPGTKKLEYLQDAGHALHLDGCKEEAFIHLIVWIKKYLPL